ncbi:DUF1501 domain-containing protein [Vibrio astriarenae]
MKLSRRNFLQSSAASFGVGALSLSPLSAVADWSKCHHDYKAVVAIDLAGGNDGYNMFIPASSESYAQYQSIRGSLAIPTEDSIPLNSSRSLPLSMHPALKPLEKWWTKDTMLPVLNQGPLVHPMTNQSIELAKIPTHLYSHSHQSTMVQSHTSSQAVSKNGFGALTSKLLEKTTMSMAEMPPLFDIGGTQVWTNSIEAKATTVGTKPPTNIFSEDESFDVTLFQRLHDSKSYANVYQRHFADVSIESRSLYHDFRSIFDTEIDDVFPDTKLGDQLKTVFKLIVNREKFSQPLQYFSCKLGGFDSHSNQLSSQHALLEQVAEALDAFHSALEHHGLSEQVVSFTHSEFGRTLIPNATNGTDHGWGSHSLVIGGAVDGGRVLGEYPDLSDNSPHILSRGRIIPTIASDQVHASILAWLGLRASGIDLLFPSLHREHGYFPEQTLPIFKYC